jgi:oxygen-independent coproporphyrinogen-3 oxidase
VHWPFCASKCPYCDFNSHVRFDPPDQARFLAAFRREIAETRRLTGPRAATSVFFGGGTPSLMAPETVDGILAAIDRAWPLEPRAEVTLEANPSSVEAERFRGYRAAGINRVSLGIQALHDDALVALGRRHTVAEALAALDVARRTFDRFTFDLIYARPGQSVEHWSAELRHALALAGDHVSLYQLTIEPGTRFSDLFAAGKLQVPEAEVADELYAVTQQITEGAGLPAYEISNHARRGAESRHNMLYWRYGSYAGLGPGAHGRLIVGAERLATSTELRPEGWLSLVEAQDHGRISAEPLSLAEQADEALLMGLRLVEGLDLTRLAALVGRVPSRQSIEGLVSAGVLERLDAGHRIRATPDGRMILNELVLRLSRGFAAGGSHV